MLKSSPCFVSLGNSIISKGRVLYFRLSVPRRHREQVGLTEFRISLKTPYIDEARAYACLNADDEDGEGEESGQV